MVHMAKTIFFSSKLGLQLIPETSIMTSSTGAPTFYLIVVYRKEGTSPTQKFKGGTTILIRRMC